MRHFIIALGLAIGLAAPVAPAQATPPAAACFSANRVTNFAAGRDEKTINVRIAGGEVFQFNLFGRCPGLDFTSKIAIASGGSRRICTGRDANIIAPSPIGPQTCLVRNLRRLSVEEVAALPSRSRP